MRRVMVLVVGVLLGVCAQGVFSTVAAADPAACQQYDSHGICVVVAASGESDGQAEPPVAAGSGTGGASVSEAPCTLHGAGTVIPCQQGPPWWPQSMQSYP